MRTGLKIALLFALVTGSSGCGDRNTDSALPRVVLATDFGDIVIEVDNRRAPASAGSFLRYVDEGRYGSAAFYRTVSPDNDNGSPPISVLQGGLPDDQDRLSPVAHESTRDSGLLHLDGTVSLARSAPGTATGGTFFICIGKQPALDYGGLRNADGQGFAAFGRVVDGMEVVRQIHSLEATGASESPYMQGQILAEPVKILAARRVP